MRVLLVSQREKSFVKERRFGVVLQELMREGESAGSTRTERPGIRYNHRRRESRLLNGNAAATHERMSMPFLLQKIFGARLRNSYVTVRCMELLIKSSISRQEA